MAELKPEYAGEWRFDPAPKSAEPLMTSEAPSR